MLGRIGIAVILWALLLHAAALPLAARRNEASQRCFAETGHCIQGRFLDFWNADLRYTTDPIQGAINSWGGDSGLTRHGYPLTDEFQQRLEDGREYTVQYFERTRLEYHPENAPPYDMLIGAVGRRSRPVDPPATALTANGNELYEPVYFPETGHNLRGFFRVYWTLHGGLAQFGQPLSEEFGAVLEDGKPYTVQYFERARFEYHPEIPPPNSVILGQLGMQALMSAERVSMASDIRGLLYHASGGTRAPASHLTTSAPRGGARPAGGGLRCAAGSCTSRGVY